MVRRGLIVSLISEAISPILEQAGSKLPCRLMYLFILCTGRSFVFKTSVDTLNVTNIAAILNRAALCVYLVIYLANYTNNNPHDPDRIKD